jgi:hypothetical protein
VVTRVYRYKYSRTVVNREGTILNSHQGSHCSEGIFESYSLRLHAKLLHRLFQDKCNRDHHWHKVGHITKASLGPVQVARSPDRMPSHSCGQEGNTQLCIMSASIDKEYRYYPLLLPALTYPLEALERRLKMCFDGRSTHNKGKQSPM